MSEYIPIPSSYKDTLISIHWLDSLTSGGAIIRIITHRRSAFFFGPVLRIDRFYRGSGAVWHTYPKKPNVIAKGCSRRKANYLGSIFATATWLREDKPVYEIYSCGRAHFPSTGGGGVEDA